MFMSYLYLRVMCLKCEGGIPQCAETTAVDGLWYIILVIKASCQHRPHSPAGHMILEFKMVSTNDFAPDVK